MAIAYEIFKSIGKRPCRPGTRNERCAMVLNENSEDLLTSIVFGLLKYLPSAIWLVPLLELAFRGRIFGAIGQGTPRVEFWKKLPSPPGEHGEGTEEVDIVITIRHLVILIECKYKSATWTPEGKSTRRDQVIRYLDAAVFNYWPDSGARRDIYFILLTDTAQEPLILSQYRNPGKVFENLSQFSPFLNKEDYEAISETMARNIGWVTWRDLLKILENTSRKSLGHIEAMIVKDLITYLKRKIRQ